MKKRFCWIIIILIALMIMSGCATKEDGKIKVVNDSGAWLDVTIDGKGYTLEAGDHVTVTWEFGPDDDKDVEITAEGLLVLDYSISRLIWGGESEIVTINANATALRISNKTSSTLTEVYISKYTEDTWGPERLEGDVIAPNEEKDWTLEPSAYDVKVVDDLENIYIKSWLDWDTLNSGIIYVLEVVGSLARRSMNNTDLK